jgi:hypothetical protein
VSVLMGGHFNVKSAQTRESPEHLGDEQFEREQDSVKAKIERQALDELAPRCGGIYEREQESYGAWGGEVSDVAVEEWFGDGIK